MRKDIKSLHNNDNETICNTLIKYINHTQKYCSQKKTSRLNVNDGLKYTPAIINRITILDRLFKNAYFLNRSLCGGPSLG